MAYKKKGKKSTVKTSKSKSKPKKGKRSVPAGVRG